MSYIETKSQSVLKKSKKSPHFRNVESGDERYEIKQNEKVSTILKIEKRSKMINIITFENI